MSYVLNILTGKRLLTENLFIIITNALTYFTGRVRGKKKHQNIELCLMNMNRKKAKEQKRQSPFYQL